MFDSHIPKIAAAIEDTATILGTGFLELSQALSVGHIISDSEKNQVLQYLDNDLATPPLCDYCSSYLNQASYYKLIDGRGPRKKSCSKCANNVPRRDSFKAKSL